MEIEDSSGGKGDIDAILRRMFDRRGFDVRGYKMSNLQRKIALRMDVLGVPSLAEYAARLETDSNEYEALFNTILVNTTQFFRDPEAWGFVKENVLPEILGRTDEIKIWSAGCASGEEAYSAAIALAESLGEELSRRAVKIYATDVDETALKLARRGTYSLDQLSGITEGAKNRYFTHSGGAYTILRNIRDMLIFSRHNLISDPPIPHIDLLLCRNVLIYFNRALQSRVISRFHYALNDNGYLWLGRAETLVTNAHEIKLLNAKWRVFKKVSSTVQPQPNSPSQSNEHTKAELGRANDNFGEVIQNIGVGFITLDEDLNVVIYNKAVQKIWGLTPEQVLGKPFFGLEISYRPVNLKEQIEQAVASGESSVVENAEYWVTRDRQTYLRIEVFPVVSGVVILVEDVTERHERREELQVTNRALEAANEKLLAENEELKNAHGEFQFINEELQCTNEEVEAVNEELKATNEELIARIEELRAMKRYMKWV